MIDKFVKEYYSLSYPAKDSEYDSMDKQRLEIKRLFYMQGKIVWNQSRNRRRIYYEQLSRFKYFYVAWKHLTYYIFLERRFNVPRHHCRALSFFKYTKMDVKAIRYQL